MTSTIRPDYNSPKPLAYVNALADALEAFVSYAEAGFLDEIPAHKPDVYYNDLVKDAVRALRAAGRPQGDRP